MAKVRRRRRSARPSTGARVEPAKGQFDFSGPDRLVTAAAKARLDLLPVLLGTPAWAGSGAGGTASPPKRPADYAAFARRDGRALRPAGIVLDASTRRCPRRPCAPGSSGTSRTTSSTGPAALRAAAMSTLAKAARKRIKAADPKAKIVMAGFADRSWELIPQVYRAGGKGVFDVVAIHPYTFKAAQRRQDRVARARRAEEAGRRQAPAVGHRGHLVARARGRSPGRSASRRPPPTRPSASRPRSRRWRGSGARSGWPGSTGSPGPRGTPTAATRSTSPACSTSPRAARSRPSRPTGRTCASPSAARTAVDAPAASAAEWEVARPTSHRSGRP